MATLPPDYESDPERRRSWQAPRDVHEVVAPELSGPMLDVGCGEGRLASLLEASVRWVGVDFSAAQLAVNPYRPVVLADMRALPFRDGSFAEVTHLWCLYHVDHPASAISEARRVLRREGRYYASTAARDNDPEIMPEGYPPTTFDAEEAEFIVGTVFDDVQCERWDARFFPLATRDEIRSYCRHNYLPIERADEVDLPLWLTKRGVHSPRPKMTIPPRDTPTGPPDDDSPQDHHSGASSAITRRSVTASRIECVAVLGQSRWP